MPYETNLVARVLFRSISSITADWVSSSPMASDKLNMLSKHPSRITQCFDLLAGNFLNLESSGALSCFDNLEIWRATVTLMLP